MQTTSLVTSGPKDLVKTMSPGSYLEFPDRVDIAQQLSKCLGLGLRRLGLGLRPRPTLAEPEDVRISAHRCLVVLWQLVSTLSTSSIYIVIIEAI